MGTDQSSNNRSIAHRISNYPVLEEFLKGNDPLAYLFDLSLPIDEQRKELYRSLYEGIGDTNCYTLHLPNENTLRVKMECSNPLGNSHYSRYWIPHLYIAEALGILKPGNSHILEVSSGSSGIALAMACNILDYDLSLIVPAEIPDSRISPMKEQRAKIIQTGNYISGCIQKLRQMLTSGDYFCPNHSEEESNLIIHIFRRIIVEYHRRYSIPDYAILGIGNGSTTQAMFEYLKGWIKKCERHSFHPTPDGKHLIFGLYAQEVDLRHVKKAMNLSDKIYTFENVDTGRIREHFKNDTEISNLGDSSLIGIHYALKISEKVRGQYFFTIGYDKNDRY